MKRFQMNVYPTSCSACSSFEVFVCLAGRKKYLESSLYSCSIFNSIYSDSESEIQDLEYRQKTNRCFLNRPFTPQSVGLVPSHDTVIRCRQTHGDENCQTWKKILFWMQKVHFLRSTIHRSVSKIESFSPDIIPALSLTIFCFIKVKNLILSLYKYSLEYGHPCDHWFFSWWSVRHILFWEEEQTISIHHFWRIPNGKKVKKNHLPTIKCKSCICFALVDPGIMRYG